MSAFTIIDAQGRPVYWGALENWPTPAPGQTIIAGHPPTPEHAWSGAAWVIPPWDAAAARAARWARIKAERTAAEFGPFTWDGSTFDADEAAQRRLIGASAASVASDVRWLTACVQALATQAGVTLPARPTMAVPWTMADNTVRTMDKDDVVDAGLALLAKVATLFGTAAAMRAAIHAASTQEQIDAITFPE